METPVLYSTGCPKCAILEQKLEEKGIKFTKITDVNEMLKIGIKSVPNMKVGDKMLDFVDAVKWVNEQ